MNTLDCLKADKTGLGLLALADYYEDIQSDLAYAQRLCAETYIKTGIIFTPIPGKDFCMSIYTVTQKQYLNVIGSNPSYFKGENYPVDSVSYYDAVAFCKKLGKEFRLPTEEEWEYCCRAGTTTEFYFGDTLNSNQANFNGNFPYGNTDTGPYLQRTCNVGSYWPNNFGLYDMHGNVWEWCSVEGDEQRSDPTQNEGSAAVAGTTTAGTAGRRPATGSSRSTGPGTTESGLY